LTNCFFRSTLGVGEERSVDMQNTNGGHERRA
jgi:hypothetical protein